MKKNTLSVAIATYNEEQNVKGCLDSIKNFADEVVIVDGKSKDKTVEIAKKLGAKVMEVENNPMFHINKNLAIKNCRSNWILLLDADERLTQELKEEIRSTMKSNPKENGYWINRKNWFLGGFLNKGGAYPDSVIRLFRNGKGLLPEKTVHEQVNISGDVGRLKCDIIHLADPSFERYLIRANRYTNETANILHGKKVKKNTITAIYYMFIKPFFTFINIYIRHRGYVDGFRGFVWALFSAFHHFIAYSKYVTVDEKK